MSGRNLYCEAPNRFQGNPVKRCAMPISMATQAQAQANGQRTCAGQFSLLGAPSSCSARFDLFRVPSVLNVHEQNHVQAPVYRASTALTASQAATACAGSGINSSQ